MLPQPLQRASRVGTSLFESTYLGLANPIHLEDVNQATNKFPKSGYEKSISAPQLANERASETDS